VTRLLKSGIAEPVEMADIKERLGKDVSAITIARKTIEKITEVVFLLHSDPWVM
jgi:hypothetical protein